MTDYVSISTSLIEPYEDVEEIEIPFPEDKYKKLLEICRLTDNSELGEVQLSQLFVNAVYHFLLGHIALDELSAIANFLWSMHVKGINNRLDVAMYGCAELNFYVRRIYDPKRPNYHGNFIGFMTDAMEYYVKHKEQVVKDESIKF